MAEDVLRNSELSVKVAALRALDLPLSVFSSLQRVNLSGCTKKLVAATAFGAVSLLFLAHHLRRRKGKKKAESPWGREGFDDLTALPPMRDAAGHRPGLSLPLHPLNCFSRSTMCHGRFYGRLSGSLQSLASRRETFHDDSEYDAGGVFWCRTSASPRMRSANSCSSCSCTNVPSCWDRGDDTDAPGMAGVPVTTPENLYLMGMELFEEALQRWEQVLTFRSRRAEDEASCASVKLGAGDAIAEESMEDIISAEFIRKLEALLQRAYRLQEEFEGALEMADPSSHSTNEKHLDLSARDDWDEPCLRDSASVASTDSFVSAAELSENRELRSTLGLGALYSCSFYEEALQMAEEDKISCRVLRTEMLECLGDTDFLAKLHCVRQACQAILCERATRMFLADTGKKILSSLILKARKSPKRFEEAFEEMMCFLEYSDHWDNTEAELTTRGVKHINFYDIVLDFILMDSFEDLENPPISIQNVVNNRWLNSSFKETAVASSCWSVLKQKRQHMKVQDGFIAHFYAVCEHISPVLAWGFLGPKSSLHDFCCFFKDQVLSFLKDIFDLEKVRYSSVDALAEDVLHLLQRRSELLLAYLGAADPLHQQSGCSGAPSRLPPGALMEARVQ